MIKVLDKTFGILEEIVKATPVPMGPMALSDKLGLNRATCSRILKMLLDSGYIVQVSRQSGYTAGPRLLTLSNMASFQSALLSKAIPLIDRAAEETRGAVLISQIYAGERYVLYLRNRIPDRMIVLTRPSFQDLFETATGVVELAYHSQKEQLTAYKAAQGKPGILPDFQNEKNLFPMMERIRREQGYHTSKGTDQGIFAVPVFSGKRFLASLGCSIAHGDYVSERIREIRDILGRTAQELSDALTNTESIG